MRVITMPHVQTKWVVMYAPVTLDLLERESIAQVILCILYYFFIHIYR